MGQFFLECKEWKACEVLGEIRFFEITYWIQIMNLLRMGWKESFFFFCYE